ncbi:MAG: BlaI/MecI/CopY family transcriptional regulator [Ruminococcus sp.]|jgi:BlaI family penicillinase repressor
MNQMPQISDAEFEVMKIIWKHEPISTPDIVEKLSHESSWSPKTVHTLLLRLEKKGAVSHEKEGRVFVYTSVIKKDAYTVRETHAFLDKFYSGAFHQMAASLMEQDVLTPEDLKELRLILERRQGD